MMRRMKRMLTVLTLCLALAAAAGAFGKTAMAQARPANEVRLEKSRWLGSASCVIRNTASFTAKVTVEKGDRVRTYYLGSGQSVKVSFGVADRKGTGILVTAFGPNLSRPSDTKWYRTNCIVPSGTDHCYVYLRY